MQNAIAYNYYEWRFLFPVNLAMLAQLNGVRFGGLLIAGVCGLFGLRVLWVYRREGDGVYDSWVRGQCAQGRLGTLNAGSWSGSWSYSGSGSAASDPLIAENGTYDVFVALLFVVASAILTGPRGQCA